MESEGRGGKPTAWCFDSAIIASPIFDSDFSDYLTMEFNRMSDGELRLCGLWIKAAIVCDWFLFATKVGWFSHIRPHAISRPLSAAIIATSSTIESLMRKIPPDRLSRF